MLCQIYILCAHSDIATKPAWKGGEEQGTTFFLFYLFFSKNHFGGTYEKTFLLKGIIINEKFCVFVTLHLYRTDFKAFPLFAEKPPKLPLFSDTAHLFSFLNVYSSRNQSSRGRDVHVSIIKTSNRSAIFVMLPLCKKNNTYLYSSWDHSIPQDLQSYSYFFFPITMTQTSLKSMAFAEVKPRVKARASQVSSCKLRNALENIAQKQMRERMILIWATSCCTSQIFNSEHHPDPNSGFGGSNW